MDSHTRIVSLASGGGGLDEGLRLALPGARTVCYVENEITAVAALANGIETKRLDDAPIWTDLRTFNGSAWRGAVDLLIGGYPCQPFSVAGRVAGHDDPRNLWPAVRDTARDCGAPLVFFENVGNHLRQGLYEVAGDLQRLGYEVASTLVTAKEIGAPHKRERLFILGRRADSGLGQLPEPEWGPLWGDGAGPAEESVAGGRLGDAYEFNGDGTGPSGPRGRGEPANNGAGLADGASGGRGELGQAAQPGRERHADGGVEGLADAERERLEGDGAAGPAAGPTRRSGRAALGDFPPGRDDYAGWATVITAGGVDLAPATAQPDVRGVANGVDAGSDLARTDKLRILGNGVVPQQAAYAFHLLARDLGIF